MTRDAEHTPTGYEDAASVVVNQAPAPSSLAGGEVSPLVQRLAYGYAIMHTAICHMAGTSGASARWYYDKANEAFGRVSPIHSITEESNPLVNGDYLSGLSNFLSALSPEAPARGEAAIWAKVEEAARRYARCYPEASDGRNTFVMFAEWAASEALTPRHEAPAYPCADHKAEGFSIDPCCPHCEAPAEGAGERGVAGVIMDGLWPILGGNHMDAEVWNEIGKVVSSALRARSSAPEAREGEAVASRGTVRTGDEVWVRAKVSDVCTSTVFVYIDTIHEKPIGSYVNWKDVCLSAQITHPAASSADKLREAIPDLSSVIAWLANGCDPQHAVTELGIYKARIDQAFSTPDALKGDA